MKRRLTACLLTIIFGIALFGTPVRAAETRISIGVTETMETFNPYGESVWLMYRV